MVTKTQALKEEDVSFIEAFKVHPRESFADSLHRFIQHYASGTAA